MCDGEQSSNLPSATHLLALQGATTNDDPPQFDNETAMELVWLREKLKEITSDRDRLLCEVANLRLELDMGELKRLPEDRSVSFFIFICFK